MLKKKKTSVLASSCVSYYHSAVPFSARKCATVGEKVIMGFKVTFFQLFQFVSFIYAYDVTEKQTGQQTLLSPASLKETDNLIYSACSWKCSLKSLELTNTFIFILLHLHLAKSIFKIQYVCTSFIMCGIGCRRHSIMNYTKRGFPCVWNGIVHSLCHISACLTRQNKSFSIFKCGGTDRVRRHGCCTAVLPPPVSSSPIWCPVLSLPRPLKCSILSS